MAITYRQLREKLNSLPEKNLDDHVTMYDQSSDEYYSAEAIEVTSGENEVLEEGHLFIIIS